MEKVIRSGDILCLLTANEKVVEYTIEEICICINKAGSYEIGIFFKELDDPTPYWMFKELNKDGLIWKKGQEKVMETIRELRKKQKEKRMQETYKEML